MGDSILCQKNNYIIIFNILFNSLISCTAMIEITACYSEHIETRFFRDGNGIIFACGVNNVYQQISRRIFLYISDC
ncbi:Uncharacterised protein [Klebsiella pneumoniae]|nr:Uncharacterised protein [Klebsiella pneumoniae]